MNKSVGIDSFAKKSKEKCVFQSLFGRNSDSEAEDSSSEEEEEQEHDSSSGEAVEGEADGEQDVTSFQSTINGALCPLVVKIREKRVLGIAHQLWPAAGYLCDYLLSHPALLSAAISRTPQDTQAQHLGLAETEIESETERDRLDVVELGAGLGLSGLYLAAYLAAPALSAALSPTLSARVVCTDVAEALPGIDENIALNAALLVDDSAAPCARSVRVAADELFWGREDHVHRLMHTHFAHCVKGERETESERQRAGPLVVAADVVYWESLFLPLVETLVLLCRDYRCMAIVAHVKRWKKDSQFFSLCKKHGLGVEVLEEKVLRERDAHHNNPDNDEVKKTVQRIYRITAAR